MCSFLCMLNVCYVVIVVIKSSCSRHEMNYRRRLRVDAEKRRRRRRWAGGTNTGGESIRIGRITVLQLCISETNEIE